MNRPQRFDITDGTSPRRKSRLRSSISLIGSRTNSSRVVCWSEPRLVRGHPRDSSRSSTSSVVTTKSTIYGSCQPFPVSAGLSLDFDVRVPKARFFQAGRAQDHCQTGCQQMTATAARSNKSWKSVG